MVIKNQISEKIEFFSKLSAAEQIIKLPKKSSIPTPKEFSIKCAVLSFFKSQPEKVIRNSQNGSINSNKQIFNKNIIYPEKEIENKNAKNKEIAEKKEIVKVNENKINKNICISPILCKKENFVENQQKSKKWNPNLCNPSEMLTRKKENISTKIIDRIHFVEENETPKERKSTEKRNITHLDTKFQSYMVYKFGKDEESDYKNVQFFPEPEINFNFVILVCKSVKGWLEIDDKNVVILELSGKFVNMVFLIGCLVKFVYPREKAINVLQTKFSLLGIKSILERHLQNFDKILEGNLEKKKPQLLFYQVIISTKIGKISAISPGTFTLIVYSENKSFTFDTKEEPNYQDDFYLIFFLNDLPIQGEIKLILFSQNNKILELNFNSFFYDLGISRIQEEEIDFLKKEKGTQIWVDMAFKENKFSFLKCPFFLQSTFFEEVQIICDHFKREINKNELKILSEKYNRIFARFVLLQNISLVNLENYVETVSSKIERNLLLNLMNPQNKFIKIPISEKEPLEKIRATEKALEILQVKPKEEKDLSKINYFNSDEDYKNETLELLLEIKEEEISKPKIVLRRPPPTKKKECEVPSVFARKPLHVTGMSSTSSVFNDLSDLVVNFDTNKFEEWFCDPVFKENEKMIFRKKTSLIDKSKFFLAQLASKNLEKRQISFEKVDFFLLNKFDKLEIEDLRNMEKLFLKEEELLKLQDYSLEEIDPLEKHMIKYSKDPLLKIVLFILIFDKKINDEKSILKKILFSYFTNFTNLIKNETLKIILKLALELTNAVNYKYTLNKKRVISFRMSSLRTLQSYKGKEKDQNLLLFLIESLQSKKEEVIKELEKFNDIHTLIEVELKEIKERINLLLSEHKDCVYKMRKVKDNLALESYLGKVLGYAFKFLKEVREEFVEVEKLAAQVKGKFCDCKDESVNSVLRDLNSFFKDLKGELVRKRN